MFDDIEINDDMDFCEGETEEFTSSEPLHNSYINDGFDHYDSSVNIFDLDCDSNTAESFLHCYGGTLTRVC